MAGGNFPKGSSHKPPSSSSSSHHRKSPWESDNNPLTRPKSNPSPKPTKPSSNPSPNPGPSPSAVHPNHPPNQIPPSAPQTNPSPGAPFPFKDPAALGPPPPPSYGFHMLERRTIFLADGSVRSYFALPPDYQDFTPLRRPVDREGRFLMMGPGGPGPELGGFDKRFPQGGPMSPDGFVRNREDPFGRGRDRDYWNSLGLDGRRGTVEGLGSKRKYGDEEQNDEIASQRREFMQPGNPNGFLRGLGNPRSQFLAGMSSSPHGQGEELRGSKYMRMGGGYENNVGFRQGGGLGESVVLKHLEVDREALKKVFLHFVKVVNENANQRKNYLEDGKHGRLQCLACGRFDKIGLNALMLLLLWIYNIC